MIGSDDGGRDRLRVGLQSWTVRRFTFDEVVTWVSRQGIGLIQTTPSHLDPESPNSERRRRKALLDRYGVRCYAIGVAATPRRGPATRALFECAKEFGMDLVIVEPEEHELFDELESLAQAFDMRVAIHNHGRGTRYADPAVVREILRSRSGRIGICLDTGWIAQAGFDPVEVFRGYEGRVFDIHFKDMKPDRSSRDAAWNDVPIGSGAANLRNLLGELQASRYNGVVAIETDADLDDPSGFVESAVRFIHDGPDHDTRSLR